MAPVFRLLRFNGLTIWLLFGTMHGFCQAFDHAARDAFVITRLADKYHIAPRNLDDSFSVGFYDQLLQRLDPERIFFTESDVHLFSRYRLRLDEEVAQRQVDFLRLLTARYSARLNQVDSLAESLAKQPFNFQIPETLTQAEDTMPPADVRGMRDKLYKEMKFEVLHELVLWNDSLPAHQPARAQQMRDSLREAVTEHDWSVWRRDINIILQTPGGIRQYVSDQYCKALALCYDPHTEFFPLSEKEDFESELGNTRFSFGFSIQQAAKGVQINTLVAGSPAFTCGLLNKGDKFRTLQWQGQKAIDVSDAGIGEVAQILSQSNHDQLVITVEKPDGSLRTVALTKGQQNPAEDNRVKSFLLKGSSTFGYISLPAFYNNWAGEGENDNGCATDVAREILKLKKEKITGLIIDLRYNGGGSMQEAVELAGIFIDAGPVAQLKARGYDKVVTLNDVHRGTIYDGPLIVLVNGYSASASELVAGTLQDYHRALIVGEPTYGKATGQVILPLDTSSEASQYAGGKPAADYLKITFSKLYRVDGSTAQFRGVIPDVVLPGLPHGKAQREAAQPFALPASNIPANAYYKPYPQMSLGALHAITAADLDTMSYFKKLAAYTRAYSSLKPVPGFSLTWKDALAREKAFPKFVPDTAAYLANYRIRNNAYDLDDIQHGLASTDMNAILIGYLEHDPYIKVCYDLLGAMTK